MNRFIQTVCLLPVVLSSYLYPDSQIPKIYQSIWPNFCKDHLFDDPKACSQMDEPSENTYYSDDYYKGTDDGDFWLYYITNDHFFPLLKQSEFSSLLPNYSNWEHIDTYPTHKWPEQFLKEATLRIMQNYFMFAFFYSNYYSIIMDLCDVADSHSLVSSKTIDTLYQTLSSIQPIFLNLYSTCLKQHPHSKIFYERGMIYFHQGEYFEALKDMKEFSKDLPEDILSIDFYMQEAITYAEQNLYDEAVISLTKVLQKDPSNKEAYFERAAAYFELGNFENSLADYLASGLKATSFTDNVHLALGITEGIVRGGIVPTLPR